MKQRAYPLLLVVVWLSVVCFAIAALLPPKDLLRDGDRTTSVKIRPGSVQLTIERDGMPAVVTYAIPADRD